MLFASDNASGAAPEIVESVVQANAGHVPSYGAEAAMERVTARLREIFEAPRAEVRLVATGTAANALALACLCPPWTTVYCHAQAHVNVDECAAPEFYSGGAKLTGLGGENGRIAPEALERALAEAEETGVHNVQRGALSLTNATEAGTAYDPDAVRRLTGAVRAYGLPVHMDGARFANAVVHLGCTPAEATWKAGVDVLSFGGTKNGCLGVEAVVLFEPERSWELELRRKRGGHLFSKHRFLSAQMEAYLADDLWRVLAGRANGRAAELARGLAALPGVRIVHPVEANAVFAALPRAAHRAAQAAGARYFLWPGKQSLDGPGDEAVTARFVCSWSTSAEEVAALVAAFAAAGVGAEG
jgi:threonine aldolase